MKIVGATAWCAQIMCLLATMLGAAELDEGGDMAGWELVRHEERDYVSAPSIQKFYRFGNLEIQGEDVWFRSSALVMKASIGSRELLINKVKFVLADAVLKLEGKPCFSRLDVRKLIDPVLRPRFITRARLFDTVVIDPAHGGEDTGARGIHGHEKDFTLKLALLLKTELEKRDIKVFLTRSDDSLITTQKRIGLANEARGSIFVSLRFNAGKAEDGGVETLAMTPQGAFSSEADDEDDAVLSFAGNQRDSENIALAAALHASVVRHFGFTDLGVKRSRPEELRGLNQPGAVFVGGFLTNTDDAKFIAAEDSQLELASTLAQAIMNFRRAIKPRPPTPKKP